MKKIFILLFALFLSVTMFAQQAKMPDPNTPVTIQNTDAGVLTKAVVEKSEVPTRAPGVTIFCEGFEGTFPPTDWTRYGTNYLSYTTGGRTTPGCFGYGVGASASPTYGITTHAFVPTAGVDFSFYTKVGVFYGSSSSYTAFRIKVSTTTNAQSAFTTIKEYSTYNYSGIHSNNVIVNNAITNWYEMSVSLAPYVGQTIYMAIEVYDRYGCDNIRIDDVCVGVKSDNDMVLSSAVYPYFEVPRNQDLPSTLSATVKNNGLLAQSNVKLEVSYDAVLQGTSPTHASLAPNATVSLTAPTLSPVITMGPHTIKYEVKQDEIEDAPVDNIFNIGFTGTRNKYSVDNGEWTTYVAGTATATYGNVFTFTKPTTLFQIEGEFYYQSGLTTSNNFSVSVRQVTGTNTVSTTVLYSQTGISKPNNAVSLIKHTLATPLVLNPGSYYIAFYGANINVLGETNGAGRIGYSGTTTGTALTALGYAPCLRLYVDPEANDLTMVANGFPYTKIPAFMAPTIPFPTTLSARAVNNGSAAQTNVKTLITYDGTPFPVSSTIATLAPGATSAVMNVTPPAGTVFPTALGTYDIAYNVSSDQTEDYPSDNTQTFPLEITNGLYAIDGVGTSDFRGVGYTTANYALGNHFTITKMSQVSQFKIGFSESATGVQNYNVIIYKKTGDNVVATSLIPPTSAYRNAAEGWVTIDITPTTLFPGDYFVGIQQTTANNIGLAYDGAPGRMCYGYTGVTALVPQTNFGSLAIRMVLNPMPPCTTTAPTNLQVVPTATAVTFSWNGDAPAYKITVNNGTIDTYYYTTTNTITITGLAAGPYTWSVTALCDDTGNPATTGTPFAVPACYEVAIPYYYGFEDGTNDSWTIPCHTQDLPASPTVNNTWVIYPPVTPATLEYNRMPRTGTKSATLRYGNNRWLFREVYLEPNDYTFSVWARQDGAAATNASITLKYGTVATVAGMTNTIVAKTGIVNGEYQEIKGDFTITTAGVYVMGIFGEINSSPWYITIDDISLTIIPDVDMQAVSVTGPKKVIATVESNFTVNVKNLGKTPAENYRVSILTEDDVELGFAIGTTLLNRNQSTNVTIPLTFAETQVGPLKLKARVDIDDDEVATNNETTLLLNMEILTMCTDMNGYAILGTATTIGTTYNNMPFNFYYGNGVAQTIYLESELNLAPGATITKLTYKYNATVEVPGKPIKVYMTHTTKADFGTGTASAANFIPTNTFTKVFDGVFTTAVGNNLELVINFDEPFIYQGGNLCIMTHREFVTELEYYTHVYWLVSDVTTNRTVRYYSDSAPFNFTNPAASTGSWAFNLAIPNVTTNEIGTKELTLNPANILGDYGVITLEHDDTYCLDEAMVYFSSNDDCHPIVDVKFDGVSKGALEEYHFTYAALGKAMLPKIEIITEYAELFLGDVVLGEDAYIEFPDAPVCVNGTVTFGTYQDCTYITNVIIDGESYGAIDHFDFNYFELESNTLPEIEIETFIPSYEIEVTTGLHGEVNSIGTIFENCEYREIFEIVPDACYTLDALIFNDEVVNLPSWTREWTTPVVDEASTLKVLFKPAPYTIGFEQIGAGTVMIKQLTPNNPDPLPLTGNMTICVDEGIKYQLTFEPATGSELVAVYINNVLQPLAVISHSYILSPMHANQTVKVVFKLIDMNILATAGPNGTITPAGNITVPYGYAQSFTIKANSGYVIEQVLVDNELLDLPYDVIDFTTYVYGFSNVTTNHTIYATFKTSYHDVTINGNTEALCGPGGGGSVYPSTMAVPYNGTQKFTFYPDAGYKVSAVYVNGVSYPPAIATGSYTFYYVTTPQSLDVCFEKIPYPITATSSGNVIMTPAAGVTYVDHGDNLTYTFEARPGYEITKLYVDNNLVPAPIPSSYTFTNVTAPHTISVVAALKPLTITATAINAGGYITPAGIIPVTYGANKIFNFYAAGGYSIKEVLIDGNNNAEAVQTGIYVFLDIKENHTIDVSFEKKTYKMRSEVAGNGSIEPFGMVDILYGEDITYTITPDYGYQVSSVLVNNIDMGAITTYTFAEVDADGTIEVLFAPEGEGGEGGEGGGLVIDETTIEGISIYSQYNTVYILNSNHLPIRDVSVMDMYGRLVWQGNPSTDNTITLDVANGIYVVRVATDDKFTITKVPIQR